MALLNSGALGGSSARRTGVSIEEDRMALKEYDVEINGVATTLQLSDEDAKARGLTAKPEVKVTEPTRNKARRAPNKDAD